MGNLTRDIWTCLQKIWYVPCAPLKPGAMSACEPRSPKYKSRHPLFLLVLTPPSLLHKEPFKSSPPAPLPPLTWMGVPEMMTIMPVGSRLNSWTSLVFGFFT